MADFTTAEILNEVSRIFRSRLDFEREGGTLNTQGEYRQLLEIAATTFLTDNDAIFYLASLVANTLNALLIREIDLVEDQLVSLDELGNIGEEVRETAVLFNAQTALLSLDASVSVVGRAETRRFSRLMDDYAERFRKNTVEPNLEILTRPREDARNIITTDLARLKNVHTSFLDTLFLLRDLLETFVALDIPSKVSANAFANIRRSLDVLIDRAEDTLAPDNIAASRQTLLTTLASKTAVDLIGTFTDPRELKFRSPVNSIPPGTNSLGRVTGTGVPASVTTSPGPWALPLPSPISITVNGGAAQQVSVDALIGSVLNGRNSENFEISLTAQHIHVLVDPVTYAPLISASTVSSIDAAFVLIGFKHLGAAISFPDLAVPGTDIFPRTITEFDILQTMSITVFNSSTNTVTATSTGAGIEGTIGFQSGHVGAYLLQGTDRFEILQVLSTTQAIVSVPSGTPLVASATLRGAPSNGTTDVQFTFGPATSIVPIGRVLIGPTVKTSQLTVGSRTVANTITDVQSEVGAFDALQGPGAALNQHVSAQAVAGDPTRLSLAIRSKLNPFVQITDQFVRIDSTVGLATIEEDSARSVLGFLQGETDTLDKLTPSELVGAILGSTTGVTASVVTTEVFEGSALTTQEGTSDVSDASVADFTTVGVQVGDQIEIRSGAAAGVFQILVVGASLGLDRSNYIANEQNLSYRIFREQVKIESTNKGRGSSLEVTGPSVFAFPTGVQLGTVPQFEAVDKFGNKLSFDGVVAVDLLRIVGSQTTFEIEAVNDTELVLKDPGLSSDVEDKGFEILSGSARKFETLNVGLTTFTASPSLLKKNGFDVNLDALDNALTVALLPGQSFVANRAQARRILADYLSILTSSPRRSGEYTVTIPTASLNLEDILLAYTANVVSALDRVIESFQDRRYERATSLLLSGDLDGFFDTTEETGSFSGAVLAASRSVVNDLPDNPSEQVAAERILNLATQSIDVPDAEIDFDDTLEELEIED